MNKTLIAVASILCLTGCVEREIQCTLHLDPRGSATWAVLEHDVHFGGDPEEQRQAEQEYLVDARAGSHDVAEALWEVGAYEVETTIVRGEVPFLVYTEAHFDSIAALLEFLLEENHAPGSRVELVHGVETTSLVLEYPLRDGGEPLFDDGAPFERIVLTQGEFVHWQGFEVEDGRVAVATSADDLASDEHGWVRRSLTWVHPPA